MSNDILNLIEVDPKIMFAKPVIKGTRIHVDLILEKLAHGNSISESLESCTSVTEQSVFACLYFASLQIRNEHI